MTFSPSEDMIGTSVGNYEVVSQLGLGGMGAVYLARHSLLGRPAAVKVLLPEMSQNRDVVNRFFNEARAATAIRHPSIVEIYDFGFLPRGNAYIIMELLQGESLAKRIERLGLLSPEAALLTARQIAGALHAAHEQQIVHRDLKPDNVFVVRDPEIAGGERIKLLDFGIAKLASEVGDNRTRTGTVMGTPAYMAPEQCRGAGNIDSRADLYALGCILYELLCGRPPFVAEGAGEVIAHHLYFSPDPPRRYQPSLPEAIELLVLQLLQKEPAARPGSAVEVISTIDQLGFGLPGAAHGLPVVSSRHAAQPTAKPTTLGGAAIAHAPPETVMVRHHARWVISAAAGGLLSLGGAFWILQDREVATLEEPNLTSSSAVAAAGLSIDATLTSVPSEASDPAASPAPASPAGLPTPLVSATPSPGLPPLPPARRAEVELRIESEPSGAEIWLGGARIGRTPFVETVARGQDARAYVLRRSGFADASVTLSAETDATRRVPLRKRPVAALRGPARTAKPVAAAQPSVATPVRTAPPANTSTPVPPAPLPAAKPPPPPTPAAAGLPAKTVTPAAPARPSRGELDGVNPFE